MFEFTIDLPLKVSLNKIYSGVHWRVRNNHKKIYHFALIEKLKGNVKKFTEPVMIAFHFSMPLKGSLDASNCAYMAKMIEDCMVDHGVLTDDTVKFVKGVHMTNTVSKRKEPAVTVMVGTASDIVQNYGRFLGIVTSQGKTGK